MKITTKVCGFASHERMRGENRTVLVLGMGTSPAVLTETVWALAHQEQPVVPDEIEGLSTSSMRILDRTASGWLHDTLKDLSQS